MRQNLAKILFQVFSNKYEIWYDTGSRNYYKFKIMVVGLEMMLKMQFFFPKPKRHRLFSPTARLCSVPYILKTGNTVKWGKNSIIEIGT